VKIQEIKNISFYWNSMSEMFIPRSVWQQSTDFKYGVFELIEADLVHQMMKDIFINRIGIENNYLIDPFSVRLQLGFRNSYDMNVD
jgi:hypothetical protein